MSSLKACDALGAFEGLIRMFDRFAFFGLLTRFSALSSVSSMLSNEEEVEVTFEGEAASLTRRIC